MSKRLQQIMLKNERGDVLHQTSRFIVVENPILGLGSLKAEGNEPGTDGMPSPRWSQPTEQELTGSSDQGVNTTPTIKEWTEPSSPTNHDEMWGPAYTPIYEFRSTVRPKNVGFSETKIMNSQQSRQQNNPSQAMVVSGVYSARVHVHSKVSF